jgi:hypothetical protein
MAVEKGDDKAAGTIARLASQGEGAAMSVITECMRILHEIRDVAPTIEAWINTTEDGGGAVGCSSSVSGRDLSLVISPDLSVTYFVVRGPEGFREAGIVLEDAAIRRLSTWVTTRGGGDFPVEGLVLAASALCGNGRGVAMIFVDEIATHRSEQRAGRGSVS